MAYLEIKKLNKAFGEKEVVKDLELSLEQGRILCLLGPSGCGKTTTLRMVGGFLPADGGEIRLDGEDITTLPPENRPVATVFQSYALFPNMNVLENVMYGLKFQSVPKKKAQEIAMEKLAVIGLSDYAKARISEISGGQQQRVALARALAVEPKLMLLDEPLSNLDAKLRIRMREELRELQQELGMTMIFVTHDQDEAMVLADEIAIMHEGHLVQTGAPRQVYDHPENEFAMGFLGTADRIVLADKSTVWLRPEKIEILGRWSLEVEQAAETAGPKKNTDEVLTSAVVRTAEYLGFYMQYHAVTEAGDEILLRGGTKEGYAAGDKLLLRFFRQDALMR